MPVVASLPAPIHGKREIGANAVFRAGAGLKQEAFGASARMAQPGRIATVPEQNRPQARVVTNSPVVREQLGFKQDIFRLVTRLLIPVRQVFIREVLVPRPERHARKLMARVPHTADKILSVSSIDIIFS